MMGWSLIVCSFAAKQAALDPAAGVSNAMLVSVGLTVLYLFKFFWWESGYLASLDIMHDRFGYYICWGVLAWVPAVYALHRAVPGAASARASVRRSRRALFVVGVAGDRAQLRRRRAAPARPRDGRSDDRVGQAARADPRAAT